MNTKLGAVVALAPILFAMASCAMPLPSGPSQKSQAVYYPIPEAPQPDQAPPPETSAQKQLDAQKVLIGMRWESAMQACGFDEQYAASQAGLQSLAYQADPNNNVSPQTYARQTQMNFMACTSAAYAERDANLKDAGDGGARSPFQILYPPPPPSASSVETDTSTTHCSVFGSDKKEIASWTTPQDCQWWIQETQAGANQNWDTEEPAEVTSAY